MKRWGELARGISYWGLCVTLTVFMWQEQGLAFAMATLLVFGITFLHAGYVMFRGPSKVPEYE